MNKEDIEKAAGENVEFQGNLDFGTIIENACRESFVLGADWRINSAWQEGSEKPDTDKGDLLIIIKDAFGKYVYVHQNAYYVLKYGCVRWAYIKDLIPTED